MAKMLMLFSRGRKLGEFRRDTALLVDPSLDAERRDFIIMYKEDQAILPLKQLLISVF